MAELRLDKNELAGLIQEVVAGVLQEFEQRRLLVNGKLALTEPEAADLLGLNAWQLRDLRLAGKISFRRIVGNRIRYILEDLAGYLDRHHEPGTAVGMSKQ